MIFLRWPFILLVLAIQFVVFVWFLYAAYEIRLYPVKIYGKIIHEFDPWFNYRAAEYLAEHGREKFFKWYDYESWYPLGRPVGTTIYPGMQITAVGIWESMKMAPAFSHDVEYPGWFKSFMKSLRATMKRKGMMFFPPTPKTISFSPMSMNDICVMIPAWFGSLASIFGGLLTYEASRSVNAGICAVGLMSILPANLMRSVAGAFDNECVAVAAILCTFWLWVRSVRTPSSWPWAFPAAISYVYMVAAWGGYIFVINSIGMHALMLVALGRFNSGVFKAYTIFYVFGTAGAVQIPVVGWTPLRSLEQIGPLGVFLGFLVLAYCDGQRRASNMPVRDFVRFRVRAFACLIAALILVACVLGPMGYFGPLSSRIRGLFVKHTKTGNPLVDSVAEHQPANAAMFGSYLNWPLEFVGLGSLVTLLKRNNAGYFLALYGYIAQHFSLKMSRLVLICGPITCIMCAIWFGAVLDFIMEPFFLFLGKTHPPDDPFYAVKNGDADTSADKGDVGKQPAKGKKTAAPAKRKSAAKSKVASEQELSLQEWEDEYRPGGLAEFKRKAKMGFFNFVPADTWDQGLAWRHAYYRGTSMRLGRVLLSLLIIFYLVFMSSFGNSAARFIQYSDNVAKQMSSPTIMKQERARDGSIVIVDDAIQGYEWLDKKTPKGSRVFAWWDYGYQITGIGRRTSLADGNTWNHEHIATLGRLLSGSQKSSHKVIRHLADYVLIMTGAVNDDLGISTHFARIGNSVFPDHCGDADPGCNKFTFIGGDNNRPSPMMKKSLVYNLYMDGAHPTAKADPNLFELAWTSSGDQMRFFKVLNVSEESREWVANPDNKICDAPGSWYCGGQYPPAIESFLAQRRSFAQVEDFNKKGEKSAYTKMIEKEKGEL